MGRLRIFLLVVFAAMAVLTVLTKHLIFQGLVNDNNVCWWAGRGWPPTPWSAGSWPSPGPSRTRDGRVTGA